MRGTSPRVLPNEEWNRAASPRPPRTEVLQKQQRFLTDHGAGGIHDVQITATLVDGVVQVQVTGTSSEAIPGLAPGVSASAAGPAEPNL